MGLQRFAREAVAGATTRAAHAQDGFVAEKLLRTGAHEGREHPEHALMGAAALPTVKALLKEGKFLLLIQAQHGGLIQACQPLHIAAGLGGDHDELFRTLLKVAGGPLLALAVIVLHGAERIRPFKLDGTTAWLLLPGHDIGQEEIMPLIPHILGEDLADNGAQGVMAGGEEVEQRILKVDSPGHDFLPWAGGTVEHLGGERLLEHLIMLRGMLVAMLPLVQVVVHIELPEIGPGHQGIAATDEVGAHFEIGRGICFGLGHPKKLAAGQPFVVPVSQGLTARRGAVLSGSMMPDPKATEAARTALLPRLVERSVCRGDFTLASGAKSDLYVDCKLTTMDPQSALLVGQAGWGLICQVAAARGVLVEAVGGLTMGADAIALAIGMMAHQANAAAEVQTFTVRKEAKGHGRTKRIEGNFRAGQSVVVIDDVITTGGSTLQAIEAIEAEGGRVAFVLALVDRQEGGRQNLEERGYAVCSVFTRADVTVG